jgi:hypothetical protein
MADAVGTDLTEDRPAIDPGYRQQYPGAPFPVSASLVGDNIPTMRRKFNEAALVRFLVHGGIDMNQLVNLPGAGE